MNPIIFAMRRPITVMVAVVAIAITCLLAVRPKAIDQKLAAYGIELPLKRMPVDIFPALNLPVIYVCQPYGGMDPAQMEGFLTNYYEYHFLYISGIHHVESRNVQGTALMKLYFHPGTNMSQAMAETINYVNRSQAFMPPGTVSPFVMRFDTGSVRRQRSNHRCIARSTAFAVLWDVTGRGRVGDHEGQHDQSLGQPADR